MEDPKSQPIQREPSYTTLLGVKGRRFRAWHYLIHKPYNKVGVWIHDWIIDYAEQQNTYPNGLFAGYGSEITYEQSLREIETNKDWARVRNWLTEIPLFDNKSPWSGTEKKVFEKQETITKDNATLAPALQDLGDLIAKDIHEAAVAAMNPGVYYPGVDDGIDPVPDEHVDLVMWAMQRELLREHRGRTPVSLFGFPRKIQRALAERRRLRYKQWGIGYNEWSKGAWSLWNVPVDEDFDPSPPGAHARMQQDEMLQSVLEASYYYGFTPDGFGGWYDGSGL